MPPRSLREWDTLQPGGLCHCVLVSGPFPVVLLGAILVSDLRQSFRVGQECLGNVLEVFRKDSRPGR